MSKENELENLYFGTIHEDQLPGLSVRGVLTGEGVSRREEWDKNNPSINVPAHCDTLWQLLEHEASQKALEVIVKKLRCTPNIALAANPHLSYDYSAYRELHYKARPYGFYPAFPVKVTAFLQFVTYSRVL